MPFLVNAQVVLVDSVYGMEEIIVVSNRLTSVQTGSTVEFYDSGLVARYKNESLAVLLMEQSGINLRTYGPGGLSNPSTRGGGSAHTAIVWNGLNLQSPMDGSANLSNIPMSALSEAYVQYGGASTLYGSGAMSGVIHLGENNVLEENNHLQINSSIGSFNNRNLGVSAKTGNQSLGISLNAFYGKTDNDFSFTNNTKYGNPTETMKNAGAKHYGFVLDNGIKLKDQSQLQASIWYQHHNKNIQSLMTDYNKSRANQLDNNLRAVLKWEKRINNLVVNYKSGLLRGEINYHNPSIADSTSHSNSLSLVQDAECKYYISRSHFINAGVNYVHEKGRATGYDGKPERNRISAYLFHKFNIHERLSLLTTIRNEYFNRQFTPLVFSEGFEWKVSPGIILNGNLAKNYRVPTMNDLYWGAGHYAEGNENLKPESSWTAELGYKRNTDRDMLHSRNSINGFYNIIDNWIIWLPGENGKWTPTNKKKGVSYGLEVKTRNQYRLSSANSFHFNAFYHLTFSKYIEGQGKNLYDGKPMLYTPVHKTTSSLSWKYRDLSLGLSHQFVGPRYYDESHTLKPYQLGNITLGYTYTLEDHRLNINFKLKNVWDTPYQVMAFYAMPGRNYLLSISWNMNH